MKIKTLLTTCLIAMAALAFGQLPRIVLQPDGDGSPQVFLNFDDAIDAAEANDRIYLSGGGFQSNEQITIDFPIHLIGAGFHPDSTVVTNATTLTTSAPIIITTGGSNSTFSGIRFDSSAPRTFIYGNQDSNDDPTGLYFERCEFMEGIDLTSVVFSEVNNSQSAFNECIFRKSVIGAINTNVVFTRCVFDDSADVTAIDGGGLLVDHCVFFENANIGNSNNCTVRNSIFASSSVALFQCLGASVQNCMTYNDAFFGNSSGFTISNSFTSEANPFADQANDEYDFTDDLNIASGSALGGALDGTDMGIYGSSVPAKLGAVPYNPHFIEVEIAPSTDGDGSLPVSIKVQAQSY